jgi:hypothetical protein
MYADPSKKVRLAFIQYLRNIPSLIESVGLLLPPSADDAAELPLG